MVWQNFKNQVKKYAVLRSQRTEGGNQRSEVRNQKMAEIRKKLTPDVCCLNSGMVWQNLKNVGKYFVVKIR